MILEKLSNQIILQLKSPTIKQKIPSYRLVLKLIKASFVEIKLSHALERGG
jgi:hypothetical protein